MGLDQFLYVSADLTHGTKMTAVEELALKATGIDKFPTERFTATSIRKRVASWRKDYRVQSWIESRWGDNAGIEEIYLSAADLDALILDMQTCVTDPAKLDELFPFVNDWDWYKNDEREDECAYSVERFTAALPRLLEIRAAYNALNQTLTYRASW